MKESKLLLEKIKIRLSEIETKINKANELDKQLSDQLQIVRVQKLKLEGALTVLKQLLENKNDG